MIIFNYILFFAVFTFLKRREIDKLSPNKDVNYMLEVLKGIGICAFILIISTSILIIQGYGKLITINNMDFPMREFIINLIAFIGVALFEEITFRCALFETLRKKFKVGTSVILTSSIFMIIHYFTYSKNPNTIQLFALAFIMGVLLQMIYLKTDSLLIPVGVHIFWNVFETFFTNVSGLDVISNIYIDVMGNTAIYNMINMIVLLLTLIIVVTSNKINLAGQYK